MRSRLPIRPRSRPPRRVQAGSRGGRASAAQRGPPAPGPRRRRRQGRVAAGSADEVVASLRVAEAWGHVDAPSIAPALAQRDRVHRRRGREPVRRAGFGNDGGGPRRRRAREAPGQDRLAEVRSLTVNVCPKWPRFQLDAFTLGRPIRGAGLPPTVAGTRLGALARRPRRVRGVRRPASRSRARTRSRAFQEVRKSHERMRA